MTSTSHRAPAIRAARGTGLRDATAAVTVAVLACAVITIAVGQGTTSAVGTIVSRVVGAVVGVAIVAAAGASVVARPARWSGPADRVTLTRAVLIAGCACVAVPVMTGALTARPWLLEVLLVPALALDAVDGAVARRTGTASAAGARLDGEMDAALLLVLSVAAAGSVGWWVLAIGLMRYAFHGAGYALPWLRGRLAFSQFRRVVAGVQGVMLATGLAPFVPLLLARAAAAVALVLLTISFGRDVATLRSSGARLRP